MTQIEIIIPVASFEPLSVIKKSVECIYDLDPSDLDIIITYVLDLTGEDDPRLKFLKGIPDDRLVVVQRTDNRGRRAGAINDAFNARWCSPDYIAILDVDSRPQPNFLIECVKALRSNQFAVIASSARFITNESENIITRIIAAEYLFFSDVYHFVARHNGFNHFNGLIGVLSMERMVDKRFCRLNESVPCEDIELTQKAYLAGLTSIFVPGTLVGEQAPVTIGELFNQRVRWLSGAYQGLRKHLSSFIHAEIPLVQKVTWFLVLSMPFAAFLMMPLVPLYTIRMAAKYGTFRALIPTIGLILHVWLISICGLVALTKQVLGRGTEWKDSSRSDV